MTPTRISGVDYFRGYGSKRIPKTNFKDSIIGLFFAINHNTQNTGGSYASDSVSFPSSYDFNNKARIFSTNTAVLYIFSKNDIVSESLYFEVSITTLYSNYGSSAVLCQLYL